MNTVHISASKSYDIHIGSGLLSQVGKFTATLAASAKVCIVSESNVWPLFGKTVQTSLEGSGFTVTSFVFPAGEQSKNAETYLNLLNFLAENAITRSDLLVALGGGVVGDLTGFAAATYLRGIRFIQLPTTLLAAVDASVGGKTAIDLPAGKNLAGAFCQPSMVLCDTDTLNTLPPEIFLDGCAEVIKYGVLYDPGLFRHLEDTLLNFERETVITRCVELKRDVVMADEFDTGERMKLNLGHTFGHSIEAASNYGISHGKAVAIGMAIVCRSCGCQDSSRILDLLIRFGLPVHTGFSAEILYNHALSDKKRSSNTITLVIPLAIGNCQLIPYSSETLQSFIQAGL